MGVVYEEEISYISSRIRELRKERRLTVQELAYRCDMERSNLSRIEGTYEPYGQNDVYHL